MNKNIKLLTMSVIFVIAVFVFNGIYAAGASITANKTNVTQGDSVKVTVSFNAAAWNIHVSGNVSDSIAGYNEDGNNVSKSKSYTINTSKVGTYTIKISGDVTDGKTDVNSNVSGSVTITVKEKQTINKDTNTNNNTTSNKTSTKSSNANISKLTLNVEGFKFNSTDTSYSINVSEKVDKLKIGVTLASSKAVYSVYGNKDFKTGLNVVKIVVTAEDGTTKTYRINVNKDGNVEESSADLSNLIIEDMTFDNAFSPETTEYVGSKIKYTEKLNVFVYTLAEEATYEIIGNENLKEGKNTVKIIVTSKDKTNKKEYIVTFEMLAKEEEDALKTISVYTENKSQNSSSDGNKNYLWEAVKDNSTIILLYLLALVEFGQVIYLYVELKRVNPDFDRYNVTRRRDKKNSDN